MLSTYSSGSSNSFIETNGNNSNTGMNIKITNNSNVNVDKTNRGDFDAPVYLYGVNTKININNGSKFKVNNSNGSAITESGTNSSFDVSGTGTELNVSRSGNANYNNSVIRFAWTGNMTFNISDNAKVNINQQGSVNTYGVRMYGGGNDISVEGGAEFNCVNNSTSSSPGIGDNDGEGIYYTGGGSGNTFNLKDKDSQVLISAKNGPAISSNSQTNINAGDGTSFIARGYFPNNAIFYSSGVLNFKMGVPRYFDFMNTASRGKNNGGYLFNCTAGSNFSHGNIPLSVWLRDSDIEDNPTKSWNYVSADYSGVNFNSFSTKTPGNGFATFLTQHQGLINLARMTANTAPGIAKNAPYQPTNADSYIWVSTMMPAENNQYRNSYDNEIYGEVQLTYPDGTKKTLIGSSMRNQKYYEYSEGSTILGTIKVPVPDGQFLETGTKINIIKLWRNDPDYNSKNAIKTDINDMKYNQYKEQTVIDKTPPLPVKIKDNPKEISQWTKTLEGTGEPGASVSWQVVHKNGNPNTVYENVSKVNSSGIWEINNISGIANDDKIIIYLTDLNLNTTPLQTTVYHDAKFPPAMVVKVGGTNTLTLDASPNLDFGSVPSFSRKIMSPKNKEFYVNVYDDRNPLKTNNWKLLASVSKFKSDQKVVDDNKLYLMLSDDNNSKVLTNTDSLIYEKSKDDPYRGMKNIDFINGPMKIKLKNNGVAYSGEYKSVITWTVTDSL